MKILKNTIFQKAYTHNKQQYDMYGHFYETKRQDPASSFWNDHIDYPAVSSLLGTNLKGKRILDLGCGSGIVASKLASKGARVFGLDNSSTMISIASGRAPKLNFAVGNATSISFKDKSFDIIVSSLLIHYLENLQLIFNEANRVLAPNGEFIFSFHHPVGEIIDYRIRKGHTVAKLKPYFHNDPYRWRMAKKMTLISFHHTFENIFAALHDCGFIVSDLREPRPLKSSKSINPKAYETSSQYPTFCAIKAIKLDIAPSIAKHHR
jgi:ubiquinone/menaquinone biosynthesis C-methylase UbiE